MWCRAAGWLYSQAYFYRHYGAYYANWKLSLHRSSFILRCNEGRLNSRCLTVALCQNISLDFTNILLLGYWIHRREKECEFTGRGCSRSHQLGMYLWEDHRKWPSQWWPLLCREHRSFWGMVASPTVAFLKGPKTLLFSADLGTMNGDRADQVTDFIVLLLPPCCEVGI